MLNPFQKVSSTPPALFPSQGDDTIDYRPGYVDGISGLILSPAEGPKSAGDEGCRIWCCRSPSLLKHSRVTIVSNQPSKMLIIRK